MTHASSWAHMSTTWGTSLGLLGRLAYREKASGHGVVSARSTAGYQSQGRLNPSSVTVTTTTSRSLSLFAHL